ncbi:hypothetical protein EYF80_047519 [Liparis tanakae]|uniref:Uncharacterized protein n=1 Tax=Liparis tanakae TaxID=230148 RepID=A0A4Z2FM28_9TELE|nr:hypothetical protein EYF80_047519 [Liparis tanakae]
MHCFTLAPVGVGVGFQCPHVIFKTANRSEETGIGWRQEMICGARCRIQQVLPDIQAASNQDPAVVWDKGPTMCQ